MKKKRLYHSKLYEKKSYQNRSYDKESCDHRFYDKRFYDKRSLADHFWSCEDGIRRYLHSRFRNWYRKFGILLLAAAVLMAVSGCGREEAVLLDAEDLVYQDAAGEAAQPEAREEKEQEQEETVLFVHICGEVVNPGVYALAAGSRVYEAVEAAGGFTEAAEQSCINLAQVLTDGIQIEIPDQTRAQEMKLEQDQEQSGRINLNTATSEQLCTLPGIGASRAESIIAYREDTGGFSKIEEIMQINGIKEAMFEKIKDKIYVGAQ